MGADGVSSGTAGGTRALATGVLVVLATLLAVLGHSLLGDGDTLWHLATAERVLATGQLPSVDPFSYTRAGEPWIAKEWLGQLVLLAAARAAGWAGVVGLTATAAAAAFALLAARLREHWQPRAVVVAVGLAFVLSAPHLLARPHVLALPLAVAWLAALVRAVDRRLGPPWWTLGLLLVWVNLHAGASLGLVVAAVVAVEACVDVADDDRRELSAAIRRWAGFLAAAAAVVCVTPYGPRSLLVTVDVLGLGPALSVIPEWQAQDFSSVGAFEVVLLAVVGGALVAGLRLAPLRAVLLLGLLHLALSSVRNGELLGLLGPLVVAAPLARQVPWFAADAAGPATATSAPEATGATAGARGRARGTLTAAGAVVAVLVAVTLLATTLRPAPPAVLRPVAAIAAVHEVGSQRLLHEYGFGGGLIAEGVHTFVDGRTELFGGPFVARHAAALELEDVGLLEQLLVEWRIDATMLRPDTPAVALLDRSVAWERVHADQLAVVHRRTAATAGLGLDAQ